MISGLYFDAYSPNSDPSAPIVNKKYEQQIEILFNAARDKKRINGKVFCISGKCGCGKTVLIKRICRKYNVEILNFTPENGIEIENFKKGEKELCITEKTLNFIKKCSFLDPYKYLIVLDGFEVPENELMKFYEILRNTVIPICWILSPELSEIRNIPFPIQRIRAPQVKSIIDVLSHICESNNIEIDDSDLKNITMKANGDIRAAINSLQFGIALKRKKFLYKRGKASKIFFGVKNVDFDSLNLAYDCLPNALGSSNDYENVIQYFSECDAGLEENDLLQETLAEAIRVNSAKNKIITIIPMDEQMKDKEIQINSLEYRIREVLKEEYGEEEENIIEDQKMQEFIDAIELMEIDPIEEASEDEFFG